MVCILQLRLAVSPLFVDVARRGVPQQQGLTPLRREDCLCRLCGTTVEEDVHLLSCKSLAAEAASLLAVIAPARLVTRDLDSLFQVPFESARLKEQEVRRLLYCDLDLLYRAPALLTVVVKAVNRFLGCCFRRLAAMGVPAPSGPGVVDSSGCGLSL